MSILLQSLFSGKKGKGKGHALDLALRSEGISLQKRSGMARVVDRFQFYLHTRARSSTNGMNHTKAHDPQGDG